MNKLIKIFFAVIIIIFILITGIYFYVSGFSTRKSTTVKLEKYVNASYLYSFEYDPTLVEFKSCGGPQDFEGEEYVVALHTAPGNFCFYPDGLNGVSIFTLKGNPEDDPYESWESGEFYQKVTLKNTNIAGHPAVIYELDIKDEQGSHNFKEARFYREDSDFKYYIRAVSPEYDEVFQKVIESFELLNGIN